MSEWRKVKIGSFLKVRQGKYKPDDDAIADLKRLYKIDFSGRIHFSDKPTKNRHDYCPFGGFGYIGHKRCKRRNCSSSRLRTNYSDNSLIGL